MALQHNGGNLLSLNRCACQGDDVTFTIVATGATTYQWQKDGTDISGATNDTFTISSVSSADLGNYTCIVSDDCGSITSNSASLTLKAATEITEQPVDVNANVGDNVSFSVVANGANLAYQWRFGAADISGAAEATYQIISVTAENAGSYDVVVTGDCGEITSNVAELSVTTSVDELSLLGINIYPNPSRGIINISNEDIENLEIVIINFAGKVIYQESHNSDKNVIDLSDEAKGIYLIKFNYEGKSVVSRVIIE